MFVSCINNGTTTSIWLDYWLRDGQQICDLLPLKVLSSIGLSWDAKVLDIMKEGTWALPSNN
jgi:hypothetical protein